MENAQDSGRVSATHERLIAALDYLEHLERLSRKPTYRISDHKLAAFFEHQLSGLPGVCFDQTAEGTEIWMQVDRLHPKSRPDPPDILKDWIVLTDDPAKHPELKESITVHVGTLSPPLQKAAFAAGVPDAEGYLTLTLSEAPSVRPSFERYSEEQWGPWAEQERPRRQTIQHYERLFNLIHTTNGQGDDGAIEFVWGVGIALWNHVPSGTGISYPLLTKLVELAIDKETLAINISPTERDVRLEADIFYSLTIPQTAQLEKYAEEVFAASEKTFSPFDRGTFEDILRFAAANLHNQGRYWPDENTAAGDRSLPSATGRLTVSDTWVVFARRRSTNFVADDVRRLKAKVHEAQEIGGCARRIVDEPPDTVVDRPRRRYRGISSTGFAADHESPTAGEVEDLYFPKPFNAEQISIVERLATAEGVVVQGPPGTGKTHTIANIVCHYMATGKRVLVTAQHEAALLPLQDQIPEPLRPLTISLLTNERDGLTQLQRAVRKIASEVPRLNRHDLELQIEAEATRIDGLYERIAALDHEIREWAHKQTTNVPFRGGQQPIDLAREIQENARTFEWFPDNLDGEEPYDPPVTDDEIRLLREARERIGRDLVYVGRGLPQEAELPSTEEISRLHESLQEIDALTDAMDSDRLPRLAQETTKVLGDAEELVATARTLLQVREEGETATGRWLWNVSRHWMSQWRESTAADPLTAPLREWLNDASALEVQREDHLGHAVELPADAEVDDGLTDAVFRAAEGRRPFGLFGGNRETKARYAEIRIDGIPPADNEQWGTVHRYLEYLREVRKLAARWNYLRVDLDGPEIHGAGRGAAKEIGEVAYKILHLRSVEEGGVPRLITGAKALFVDGFDFDSLAYEVEPLQFLIDVLDVHIRRARLQEAIVARQAILDGLSGMSGPVTEDVRAFVSERLGEGTASLSTIRREWAEFLAELRRLEGIRSDLETVVRVTGQIEQAGAPRWAAALRTVIAGSEDGDLLPASWRQAWEWARGKGYVKAIDGRERLQRVATERLQAEDDLAKANLRLVELRTWLQLKASMTDKVGAALASYLDAILKLRKGTGIRAVRYRRNARNAMRTAHRAVPCWIMPHWRVSESLPAELESFDLVIIDEASQSDAWALPAILRAKQILIVGDDKQVSPSDVGVRESDITSLHDRFLSDLPYGHLLLPGASIYALGSTTFASDVVRLREHFRCVEPIIHFSNKEFYDGEILPLRVPKPSERLDPPLVDVFVKNGYRNERKKINKPEAQAIVGEIHRLSEEPRFEGRSIGVVSLLGPEQARYIQDLLLAEVGEEAILAHDIRCGNAMHFQGKEADIVLVSMVAAGKIMAQTGRLFEQRYNVACSRARDRMYVFRSFTREQLTDADLRAKLLDHLERPLDHDRREVETLRELCESNFERDVFDELVAKGHRVVPQVRSGGYRIDLVVEGEDDRRLAVELDGDNYHGFEQWQQDIGRQRVLERQGWHFWRCWGSSYYADKEGCLADLYRELAARGIDPVGSINAAVSDITRHVTIGVVDEAKTAPEVAEEKAPPTVVVEEPSLPYEEAPPVIPPTEARRPAEKVAPTGPVPMVEVGDAVRFVYVDDPENIVTVQIVHGASDPKSGRINAMTPLAEALLGAEKGDEVDANLPHGVRRLRILEIRKH